MFPFVLAYLGGVLTIASPCILPVLPFVFARADRTFAEHGLPLLIGLTLSFTAVATLAAVAGGWAIDANRYGRGVALTLLSLFGASLIVPTVSKWLMLPVLAFGVRISPASQGGTHVGGAAEGSPLLLGVAIGFIWAPCAGPILGLILTAAALQGAGLQTTLLLAAYATGAATSLAIALVVGGRLAAAMRGSLAFNAPIKRALGAMVLASVAALTLGLDTKLQTISLGDTAKWENCLIETLNAVSHRPAEPTVLAVNSALPTPLPKEGSAGDLTGAVHWINTPPLTINSLKHKVVLVNFWTYSCINCLRALPYFQAWAEHYKNAGLVVIGVHTPEFAFEKNVNNVETAVVDLGLRYPVAMDNTFAIWRAFSNRFWPAQYLVDGTGQIRFHHFGEGEYDGLEAAIRQLLVETGYGGRIPALASVRATGIAVASDINSLQSPETYIGYAKGQNFVSPGGVVPDTSHTYLNASPKLNEWSLGGDWTVGAEYASLNQKAGRIRLRFRARDVHLVLGPSAAGHSVRFRITLDGMPPGQERGTDCNKDGSGSVAQQRLYHLVRQQTDVAERTIEIEFLDAGVQAYAFTFG